MATKKQVEDLSNALLKAFGRASALSEVEDGGTCNFDSPQLILTEWRADEIKSAFCAAGIIYDVKGTRKSSIVDIIGCTNGQGSRRTAMAEAFCDSLKEDGYEAYVYYQMD